MRILHVFDHSLPLQSGYTFRSANILHGQRQLGWETLHLTSPKQHSGVLLEEQIGDLHFYRTPYAPRVINQIPAINQWAMMRATQRRLFTLATQLKPDILHAHSPVLNAWPVINVGKQLGIPTVYEIRAFWEDAAVDLGTQTEGNLRYRLTRLLETRATQRVNQVVTICQGLRDDLIARGLGADKITVVPNAVNIAQFQYNTAPDVELKQRLGLTHQRVIGFLGSYYPYEGLDLLITALPTILKQAPDVRVLLVGGGIQENSLKQQAAQLGLTDKVLFIGRIPHADIQRYYSIVDLLVYPRHAMRLTHLVTPLKPLEAMAQGHLLVASDVGGHQELIAHGKTGFLFRAEDVADLAHTILTALTLPDRGQTIRTQARHFVETERNWTNSVANYQHVYTHAMQLHSGTSA